MKNSILALSLILLSACSSGIVYKPLEDMPVSPDYSIYFVSPDSMSLNIKMTQTMKAGKQANSFIYKVKEIKSDVKFGDKTLGNMLADSINVVENGFGNNSVSTNLDAKLGWKKPKYVNSNTLSFDMQVITNKVVYTGSKTLKEISDASGDISKRSLSLTPKIEILNDSNVVFTIEAVRNFLEEKEYIPNSELLRVEILTMGGKPVFKSNHNMNYFQVIKKLLPVEIGNSFEYQYTWNGKDNDGYAVEPGRYDVRLTIPARPMPFIVSTTLEWKLGND